MMKITTFFVFAAAFISVHSASVRTLAHFSPEVGNGVRKAMNDCSKHESHVPELLRMLKEGTWKEDQEFKHFIHCVYKEAGYSKADGRVIIDKSASIFPDPAVMKSVLTECDKEYTDDPVETTFLAYKCFQINSPYLANL